MDEREQDTADKTEDPTDERRKQYREEGQIANPREVLTALSLILLTILFYFASSGLLTNFQEIFMRAFQISSRAQVNEHTISKMFLYVFEPIMPWLVGILVILASIPTLTGLLLTKFNWSTKKISLNTDNLSFTNGIKRVFGLGTVPTTIKLLIKGAVLFTCIYFVVKDEIIDSVSHNLIQLPTLVSLWATAGMKLLTIVCIFSFLYGAGEYGYNLWQMERQMMMTKKELKDEIKGQEGDPHVRHARRRMLRSFMQQANLKNVPQATFIVTNPEHYSVAVRYANGMGAPIVIAKGVDFWALRIREVAKENDVAIVENKPLARTLYATVKVGEEVPANLFHSVIEVMKFIYRTRGTRYFERFNLQSAMHRN